MYIEIDEEALAERDAAEEAEHDAACELEYVMDSAPYKRCIATGSNHDYALGYAQAVLDRKDLDKKATDLMFKRINNPQVTQSLSAFQTGKETRYAAVEAN